jgi:zinc transport system substrate-binding protein
LKPICSEDKSMQSARTWFLLAVCAAGLVTGCREEAPDTSNRVPAESIRPRVLVTHYPLDYFASRIGGNQVKVEFPMTGEGDPAFWQPDSPTIVRYQQADLILINGATYEKWLVDATLPERKIVDTSAGFKDRYIQVENAVTHSHGPGGTHSHSGTAFTTWIDFDQAARQASVIHDALVKLVPDRQAEFDQNHQSLLNDLRQLDQQMREVAKNIGDRPLMVSHPVYQYWARRYSLNIQSVLWEPDVVPDEDAVAELNAILQTHPAHLMIWEGTPAAESVAKLKSLGLESVVFDPCATSRTAGDWRAVMHSNIEALGRWEADSR